MRKNKFIKVEKEIDDIAEKMFKSGQSITSIAKELKIDRGCLSVRLKARGLDIKQHCNKKSINSNYFDEIDSEEKAYWLGFLIADGYISDDNKVELCLKDKDHIEKFKKSLNLGNKISIKKVKQYTAYRISFKDNHIGERLKNLGCIPRKTFKLSLPILNDVFMRHFIRGYFDGDGCICMQDSLNKTQISFTCGCENFLIQLCEYLNSKLNFSTDLYVRQSHTAYEIRLFNNINKKELLNYLYKNSSIYLDRKYKLYTHMPS